MSKLFIPGPRTPPTKKTNKQTNQPTNQKGKNRKKRDPTEKKKP
jgi:hypothetical protein